jgi:anti-anti-sigma factor
MARTTEPLQERDSRLAPGSTIVIARGGDEGELGGRLRASLDFGARFVVVDLGETAIFDASLLTVLKRVAAKLRARGGGLSVVCADQRLANLLDLTLLSRSFTVHPTLESALTHSAP